jgi:p-aminobenzoyl-glutamate transporter AbgT
MVAMSFWYVVDAVAVGIVLPWIVATYRLIAAFRQSVGAGLAKWAIYAAICVPAMLLVMWGIQNLR